MSASEDLLTSPPQPDDFTPLAAHEAQTPGTFFGGRAVLHWQGTDAYLRVAKDETLPSASEGSVQWWLQQNDESATEVANGDGSGSFSARRVDVWVTSSNLILFSQAAKTGIRLSYNLITFHAQDSDAVLLGLNLSDPDDMTDEDMVFLHARLVPEKTPIQSNGDSTSTEPHSDEPTARALFDAISACQELNPDPPRPGDGEDEDEGEGGLLGGGDLSAPGAGGWITSENMQDYLDENGQFRMPSEMMVVGDGDEGGQEWDGENGDVNGAREVQEGLGGGAGTRRRAADADGEAADETKWQRTG